MELSKKVKTSLDEARILVIGGQILLGFQFRAAFEDAFDLLPVHARCLDAIALVLMLAAMTLLVAPAPFHRIAMGGEDSGRVQHFISSTTSVALFPFAISIGLSLFIGMERIFGIWAALSAGGGFGALALFAWYGWGCIRRISFGRKEREMAALQRNDTEKTPLHTKIEQMLTEARVILPGAQALFGFQLAIIATRSFDKLPEFSKAMHAIGLGFIALAVILLMAPAAYHRIVYAGEDAPDFHRIGSVMVTAATVPLALGISADVFVVITKIAGPVLGTGVSALALAGFIAMWHIYPVIRARRASARTPA